MNWTRPTEAHRDFKQFEGLDAFMAYEVVCDLRYTRFLEHASGKSVDSVIWRWAES